MNEVDKLLSITADCFEANLIPPATNQIAMLVSAGQKPQIVRMLKEYQDNAALVITVMRTSDVTGDSDAVS